MPLHSFRRHLPHPAKPTVATPNPTGRTGVQLGAELGLEVAQSHEVEGGAACAKRLLNDGPGHELGGPMPAGLGTMCPGPEEKLPAFYREHSGRDVHPVRQVHRHSDEIPGGAQVTKAMKYPLTLEIDGVATTDVHLLDLLEMLLHEALVRLKPHLQALLHPPRDIPARAVFELPQRPSLVTGEQGHPVSRPRLLTEAETSHCFRLEIWAHDFDVMHADSSLQVLRHFFQ